MRRSRNKTEFPNTKEGEDNIKKIYKTCMNFSGP